MAIRTQTPVGYSNRRLLARVVAGLLLCLQLVAAVDRAVVGGGVVESAVVDGAVVDGADHAGHHPVQHPWAQSQQVQHQSQPHDHHLQHHRPQHHAGTVAPAALPAVMDSPAAGDCGHQPDCSHCDGDTCIHHCQFAAAMVAAGGVRMPVAPALLLYRPPFVLAQVPAPPDRPPAA